MLEFQGKNDGPGLRIGIVVSRWNSNITESLLRGALRALIASDVADDSITVVRVPGAWEIPLAAKQLASSANYDAIIALGCVIKGETAHFEYISEAAMEGIRNVSLELQIPITCGILTTYTEEQALDRAGDNEDNKGSEAALSAIEMSRLFHMIPKATA
jgi:6,7-dimethyl-8-ribityllumazine synthase